MRGAPRVAAPERAGAPRPQPRASGAVECGVCSTLVGGGGGARTGASAAGALPVARLVPQPLTGRPAGRGRAAPLAAPPAAAAPSQVGGEGARRPRLSWGCGDGGSGVAATEVIAAGFGVASLGGGRGTELR